MRSRRVVPIVVGFGPALCWTAWATLRYRDALGTGQALALAWISGMGVLGLSALVLAWTPRLLERAGLRRAAAWLRRHWDEDAR